MPNGNIWVHKTKAVVFRSAMIKILVGPDEQPFSIHEALLTARSNFFNNAMTGSWVEAETKTVELPEDDPEVFALYEQLVYTGAIPGRSRDATYGVSDHHGGCAEEFQSLCELYILSDKLQDTRAKNAALSALVIKANEEHPTAFYLRDRNVEKCFPPAEMITRMYEGTHEGSLGRKFLADCYAYHASDLPNMLPPVEDVPMEFFRDIAMAALEKGSSRRRTLLAEWYAEKPMPKPTPKPTPKPKGVVPFFAHRAPVSVTTSPHPSAFVRRKLSFY